MNERLCERCGEWYTEDVFFEKEHVRKNSYARRSICTGCRETARTDEKVNGNRALKKAQSAIGTHTPKLMGRGFIKSKQELIERYGWNDKQMAHDIEHAFGNGCPYCFQSFASMPHGMGDVTLDIVDRDKPPYYRTNVRWVCTTCNRAKSKTDPGLWAEKLAMWDRWRRRQELLRYDTFAGLPLFAQAGITSWPDSSVSKP